MKRRDIVRMVEPQLSDEAINNAIRVMRSGSIAQGPEVAAFEEEFASFLETDSHCVAVSSGTAALHAGLIASGIGPGHEVLCPSFTFAATANAIRLVGATPVFCDIRSDTFCLDIADAEKRVTARTKAVLAVHLYGHPSDLDGLQDMTSATGMMLIEDSAQAHGARWGGRAVGTFGFFGAFSFYPTKNMTSVEGGMIVLRDDGAARTARAFRNQGMIERYANEIVGHNLRMSDVHAAVGRGQLKGLKKNNEIRQRIAAYYDENIHAAKTPVVDQRATHVYHQYTIRIGAGRDRVAQCMLEEYGVQTGVYYPVPVHCLPPFSSSLKLPVTEELANQCLSLPIHPGLTSSEVSRVVEAVNLAVGGVGGSV